MRVSIVTVVFNNRATIASTIDSVLSQTHDDIEHIVIDGGSTDGTVELIASYGKSVATFVSEPDRGIYDAMNKGIRLATGDVVGTLNADDFYADDAVISTVVDEFNAKGVDAVFGDVVFVKPENLRKIVRFYSSRDCTPEKFAYGWMPAHPTFFVKRAVYCRFGLYKTDYAIAADYELLTRVLAGQRISYSYLPKVLVTMRTGGVSTRNLKSNYILNKEIVRACHENGIDTNMMKVSSKYFKKVFQLVDRPS
jgi:glycosyltransferase involved in cell wall biosynthesis